MYKNCKLILTNYYYKSITNTLALPSRDSKIRGTIMAIAKTNRILKRPVNKLFPRH